MADSFRSAPPDQQWSGGNSTSNGFGSNSNTNSGPTHDDHNDAGINGDVGRTVLIGLLGGLVSAAGYLVYRRLPDEQRERLHTQVRGAVQQRISELRQNFNI